MSDENNGKQDEAAEEKEKSEEAVPVVDTHGLYRNPVSIVGALIAIIAALNVAILMIAEMTHEGGANPYLGIMAYIVAPAVMILGFGVLFGGMILERRRRRLTSGGAIGFPVIDFNNARHVRNFVMSIAGAALFFGISIFGSYKAFHYTETDEFCGTMCHEVMHPEYTAYKASPHSRVGCVQCHVGSGADWYVKSKLSGAYQIYSTAFNKYPRPITTPVHNLRPAQETCEQCHWPEKFWGAQLKVFNHFGFDEANTPRETQLLIKTGGGGNEAAGGATAGIHWHMNIANEIWYYPSDDQHQVIPYFRARSREGVVKEYFSQTLEQPPASELVESNLRKMDCVSCHNRPTHIYVPPATSVDRALLADRIDRTLPYIKAKAVEALEGEYATTPEAIEAIRATMLKYYEDQHPDVVSSRGAAVEQAIAVTQDIFRNTIFPEMKVDWRTHPNNAGHLYSAGCFRCHDDDHQTADGEVLTKDCNVCHAVLEQKEAGVMMVETPDNEFTHPVDLGDMREFNCIDCHTGSTM